MTEYFAHIEKTELHLIPRELFRKTDATLFATDSGLKIHTTSKETRQRVIDALSPVIPDIEERFEEEV